MLYKVHASPEAAFKYIWLMLAKVLVICYLSRPINGTQ